MSNFEPPKGAEEIDVESETDDRLVDTHTLIHTNIIIHNLGLNIVVMYPTSKGMLQDMTFQHR